MDLFAERTASEVLAVFENVVFAFLNSLFNEGRSGGILRVWNRTSYYPLIVAPIGKNIPYYKMHQYLFYSEEKGRRLMANPSHLSSWVSRDADNDLYGGGIVTPNYIVTFSGFSEIWDETICLSGSLELAWLDLERATTICSISHNEMFPLFDKYCRCDLA